MLIQRKPIFSGKIIDLSIDHVQLPNGQHCDLEMVHHPGGAASIAIDDNANVCLLRQYRHAADDWIWELPAGKLEQDETPLVTAQRELAEEAGICAAHWKTIGQHLSSPGVFTEIIYLYYATQLSMINQNLENDEVIEVHWLPFSKALNMAQTGEIQDAKTLIGLYRTQTFLHTGASGLTNKA